MNSLVKNFALRVYGTGIVGNTLYGIYDQNMELESQKSKKDIKYYDYGINSFIGAGIGLYSGFLWPVTMIGQVTMKIDKVLSDRK